MGLHCWLSFLARCGATCLVHLPPALLAPLAARLAPRAAAGHDGDLLRRLLTGAATAAAGAAASVTVL